VEQSLPAATEVKEGTKVNITIYEYTEVNIPRFNNKEKVSNVVNQLKALGLVPELIEGTEPSDLLVEIVQGRGPVPYGSKVQIIGAPEPEPEPEPGPGPNETPAG
jgi:serine/threonine-protein kinase